MNMYEFIMLTHTHKWKRVCPCPAPSCLQVRQLQEQLASDAHQAQEQLGALQSQMAAERQDAQHSMVSGRGGTLPRGGLGQACTWLPRTLQRNPQFVMRVE